MRQSQVKQNVMSFSRESCDINNLLYFCPTLSMGHTLLTGSVCVWVYTGIYLPEINISHSQRHLSPASGPFIVFTGCSDGGFYTGLRLALHACVCVFGRGWVSVCVVVVVVVSLQLTRRVDSHNWFCIGLRDPQGMLKNEREEREIEKAQGRDRDRPNLFPVNKYNLICYSQTAYNTCIEFQRVFSVLPSVRPKNWERYEIRYFQP